MKLTQIFRSLIRDRLNTSVIIISLAIGIAAFNLIIIFISRELKTDHFQSRNDQIYALKCDDPWIPGGKMYHCRFGSAEYMKENFAQVEDFCRINGASSQRIVVNKEEYFDKPACIAASSNFFDFFSYKLLTNNPGSALEAANNLVISTTLAKKYFGSENPVGKVITFFNGEKGENMVVTGIFEKPADNTQIRFDMVRLIRETDSRCYVRLKKQANAQEVEKLFKEKKGTIPIINTGTPGSYYLEPFMKTYFNIARGASFEVSRNKNDLLIALIIGLMILGVASFNYLGLLTNKLIRKTNENNIRRINGGSEFSLVLDFMVENLIVIGVSFILSLVLMAELVPFFNKLTGSTITNNFILQSGQLMILTGIVLFLFIVTLLFAFYRIHSNINTGFLKSAQSQKVKRVQLPAFNILQIASSIGLIICSMVIIRQMNFISDRPIGLNKQVIEVKLPGQYANKATVFKEELMKDISIDKVSVVSASPVLEHFLLLLKYREDGVEKEYSPAGFTGDENYLTTMGIELIDGPGFSENLTSDKNKLLINESMVRLFPNQSLIGKSLPGMDDRIVAGVVKDFHYSSLKSTIEPAFIAFDNKGSHLMVKPADNQVTRARQTITLVWQKLIPDYPLNIESVGDRYEWLHKENKNYIMLIGSCSLISLFLSMIGLFAVSYQTSRYRTKEIGIRKINGARIINILQLLNKDYLKWVALACVLASPVAWYFMHKWLQNFAYKTDFGWWIFAVSGIIALSVILLTVSWQSWRAATKNPVRALRYE